MDRTLFDHYTDYLICSFGPATATGLSRLSEGQISHDQVTRFLGAEDFTSAQLWHEVKALVRKIERDDGVIAVDDSIVEKPYSEENDIVCWHFDHAHERLVKGINFMTALYNADGVTVPVAFDVVDKTVLYTDKKSGRIKRKSDKTKNARCRRLLKACFDNHIPFRYVVCDVFFASAENMRRIKQEMGKDFVMPIKSNHNFALSLEDKLSGRYLAIKDVDLQDRDQRIVYLPGLTFPLALTKKVFTNKDNSQGTLYLVTSDLTLNNDQILDLYHKRWSIEEYHESLKQNAALPKSPAHTARTQANHLFCSLCAFVKLEWIKLSSKLNQYAIKRQIYQSAIMAAKKQLEQIKQTFLNPVLCAGQT